MRELSKAKKAKVSDENPRYQMFTVVEMKCGLRELFIWQKRWLRKIKAIFPEPSL